MIREIILVQVIEGETLNTSMSKAFSNVDKAEKYFKSIMRETFEVDDDDVIEDALDDGYYDGNNFLSLSIKEISFEED